MYDVSVYTGMPMADKERNAPLHYTWKQSSYLATRKEQLSDVLESIEPFKPVSNYILNVQCVYDTINIALSPGSSIFSTCTRKWRGAYYLMSCDECPPPPLFSRTLKRSGSLGTRVP